MGRALVIGFGNPLRADDGVGCHAAERIRREEVDVLTCRQLTPELAEQVARAALVIFLDASVDLEPGTVSTGPVEVEGSGAWSHHLSPGQLLGLAREIFGAAPPAFAITAGIESVDWGEGLTATVDLCAGEMAGVAGRLLEQHSFEAGVNGAR